jgi:uncharacterized membrane protein (DUF485 family)
MGNLAAQGGTRMASDAPDVGSGSTATPDPLERTGTPTPGEEVDPVGQGGVDELARRHGRFVWPMTAFFLVYYMLLMWLPSVAPGLMGRKVVGNFTFAYLFALSQFVMTFLVAWAYTRFARRRLDPLVDSIRARAGRTSSGEVTR